MDANTVAPVAEPPGQAPQRIPEPCFAESNFDELTPEEQERVRERFAHLFISVFKHD